jgi:hypothetical protein
MQGDVGDAFCGEPCRPPPPHAAGFGILTAASFAPIISVLVVNLIKEAVLKLLKTRREAGGRVRPISE